MWRESCSSRCAALLYIMNAARLYKHLENLDIEVLGENSSGWLSARCPFAEDRHERGYDRNPSFFVHIDEHHTSGFNCFTCKTHGSIVGLYEKLGAIRGENYMREIIEANMDEVPDDFGEFGASRFIKEAAKPLEELIFAGMYSSAWDIADSREYLVKRGIGQHTVEALDLLYDVDEKRILFPVRDREMNLYGFTGRTILDAKQYPYEDFPRVRDYAGLKKEQLLLGENLFNAGKPVLIVEGLFALARAVEKRATKFCNPMATMGSRLSDDQAERLIDMGADVFMLYDDDAAGDIGLYGTNTDNGWSGGALDKLKHDLPTYVAAFPEDRDDVDEFNKSDFRFAIEEADSASVDL